MGILLIAVRGVAQTQSLALEAAELVRQAVAHELTATNTVDQYMYRVHEVTPHGSETSIMVETRELPISRLILKNGEPLPPAARQREEERLRKLLKSPGLLAKLQAEKLADDARVQRVIQALPDAFLYEPAGTETNSASRQLVWVKFRPNPDFRSRIAEVRLLQAVEGAMLIDSEAKRVVRVEAKLRRDIDFGWGIFGRVFRGGIISLEQQIVGHDRWAITTLALRYTNRRLLLIRSHIESETKASDFRRLPDALSLQQALELLLDQDPMTADVPESEKTP